MMHRRSIFATLFAIPTALAAKFTVKQNPLEATGLEPATDILKSFDAREWAKHFVAYVRHNPGIATDEETMTTWFANALMRGYDEAERKGDAELVQLRQENEVLLDLTRGLVSRPNIDNVMEERRIAIARLSEVIEHGPSKSAVIDLLNISQSDLSNRYARHIQELT